MRETSSPRSSSSWMTKAVEERARPKPLISAGSRSWPKQGPRDEDRSGQRDLRRSHAEHGPANAPRSAGLHFEADDEEQHDAEFGDRAESGDVAGDRETRWTDEDAGQQKAQNDQKPAGGRRRCW
ncbi:MAG: hypothetical protein R3C97_02810 [Geminicoccaceae bacterium]